MVWESVGREERRDEEGPALIYAVKKALNLPAIHFLQLFGVLLAVAGRVLYRP